MLQRAQGSYSTRQPRTILSPRRRPYRPSATLSLTLRRLTLSLHLSVSSHSNPANAGANTLEIAKTSASVGTKSYSNINRIVCHVTTSVVHTRASFWRVRHSPTTTTTVPDSQPSTTTSILEILSTLTEIPAAVATTVFEDSTRTLGTTEYVGHFWEYITEPYTPTYWLPRSTVYAAYNANNIVGGIQGVGIQHVSPGSGSEGLFYRAVNADSAQRCCEACVIESEEEVCVGSMWLKGRSMPFDV